jgi:hypothetical protein
VVESILKEQQEKYNRFMNGEILTPYIIIVLDDIIAGHNLRYVNELWEQLVFSGRHYLTFVVLCTQDVKGIGPDTRHNADLIALTYQTQKRSLDSIYSDYASFFGPHTDKFDKFIQKYTSNHGLIIIDQTEARYGIKDTFFWDRAPNPDKHELIYKIGDSAFWKESGCNWRKQLELARKTPAKKDKKFWKKQADIRWKKDKEDEQTEEVNFEDELEFNNPRFAPPEYRDIITNLTLRKIGKSNVQRAYERMNNLGRYIPGPKY